jgi:predicted MFS family arabinose efflux permease
MVLAGWLAESIGWRWTFVVLGLPGILLAVLIRVSLREPTRGFFDEVKADPSTVSFGHTARTLWNCRTYRLLVLFLVANGFLQYGLNQWWPSFYTRTYQLSLSAIGSYLGIAIGVGSAIGLLCGGGVANHAARRDVGLPLKIGAGVTVFVIPTAMGTLFVSSASASMLMVGLTALFWTMSLGTVLATMYSVTPPQMRATGGAVYIFFMSVFGFGLGPYCVGLLSDFLSPSLGTDALRYAMLAPIAVLPLMVVVLYRAALALPKDLRAMGARVRDDTAAAASKLPQVAVDKLRPAVAVVRKTEET